MVQAILAGRKSQTRRAVKPQPDEDGLARHLVNLAWEDTSGNQYKCPYGKPGDVLWVREAYCPEFFDGNIHCYKADFNETAYEFVSEPKWKPSIHMPKDAARIWLRITDVRVERLQDITGQDAISEGVIFTPHGPSSLLESWGAANKLFQNIWQRINGSDRWNANPWVWVIEFERIEKP